MRPRRWPEILFLILWIFVVMLLFRWIEDRRWAASLAGFGFVFLPSFALLRELRRGEEKSWIVVAGLLQFLILFAGPIFLSRILFWNENFDSIHFYGVPAAQWHQLSSRSYSVLILILVFFEFRFWKINKAKSETKSSQVPEASR